MRYVIAALMCAAVTAPPPAGAAGIEDLVRANCSKAILAATDVSRSALKSFRISRHGDGFEMTGQSEEQRTVTCEAASDGHVTWVHGG